MRVVEVSRGSLLARIASSALLVLALIGMHHLTAVGCAAVVGDHPHHEAIAVVHGDVPTGQPDDHGAPSADSPITPGAVCLAVLFTVALAIPVIRLLMPREGNKDRDAARFPDLQRDKDPPDLTALSISRT